MKKIKENLFSKANFNKTLCFGFVIILYIVIEILVKGVGMPRSFTGLLVPVCCYIAMSLALNLCVGISGELSLGHAGFMSVGAFSAAIVSGLLENAINNEILILIISLLSGGVVAGIIGLLISIPVLKLSGDYLAIVTLAFGQIIKSLFINIYLGYDGNGLHFSFMENNIELNGGRMLLAGPIGATDINNISSFTAGIILILFTLFVIFSLCNSKYGRAIMAARDNKIAASSIGVSISKSKTLAFVISAGLAGMAGGLYALNYSSLQPSKFDFNTSILILVYVVLGGLGNVFGSMIATMILYLLPELLRSLSDYRMLIYSIILIAIMLITNNNYIKQLFNKFLGKEKQHE